MMDSGGEVQVVGESNTGAIVTGPLIDVTTVKENKNLVTGPLLDVTMVNENKNLVTGPLLDVTVVNDNENLVTGPLLDVTMVDDSENVVIGTIIDVLRGYDNKNLVTGPLLDVTMANDNENLVEPPQKGTDKLYPCTLCPFEGKTRKILNDHVGTHTGKMPFACRHPGCQFTSTANSILNRHMVMHKKDPIFPCTSCDLKFESKATLDQHTKILHGHTTKPYACPVCPYRGKRKAHVVRHLAAIHTNEKAYKCQQCDFQTNLKTEMDAHTKKEHFGSQPQEKWCQCPHCEFTCHRAFDLKKHLRLHVDKKPHSCQFCEYRAARRGQLKTHVSTKHQRELFTTTQGHGQGFFYGGYQQQHQQQQQQQQGNENDGGKYLHCDHCPFFTISNAEFVAHSQSHGEEKIYHCGQCQFTTTSQGRLIIHQQSHHQLMMDDTNLWAVAAPPPPLPLPVDGLSIPMLSMSSGGQFWDNWAPQSTHNSFDEIVKFNDNPDLVGFDDLMDSSSQGLDDFKFSDQTNSEFDGFKFLTATVALDDDDVDFLSATNSEGLLDEIQYLNVTNDGQEGFMCPSASSSGSQLGTTCLASGMEHEGDEPCILCRCAKELRWAEADQSLQCLQ